MTKDGTVKAATWVYTWNNPNRDAEEHHASFSAVDPVYHLFQREVGESGTPHFQGYVEFNVARSLKQLKAINPQIHWEKRMGNQAQAVAYSRKCCGHHYKTPGSTPCSDDRRLEGPWAFGSPKSCAKTGCDKGFVDAVKAGKRLRAVHDAFPEEVRKYPRYYQTLRSLYPPAPRDGAPSVVLLIGPPGCGKSRWARSQCDLADLYFKPVDANMWMDGYDLHPHVLLDDFAGAANHIALVNLLQLLDRYTVQVPIKGGFTWWKPDCIYVTTNIHPRDWYSWDKRECQFHALARRFTRVLEWFGDDEVPADFGPESIDWDNFWTVTAPGRLDVPRTPPPLHTPFTKQD